MLSQIGQNLYGGKYRERVRERERERGRRAYREIEKVFVFFFGKEFDTCKIYNYPCKTLLYI